MVVALAASIPSLADEWPDAPADASEVADIAPAANPDPWESVNRRIYTFNDAADRYLLKPVAKGYQWVMPQFMEEGVHRMFVNAGEVGNTLNCLLQAKFVGSGVSLGRLLINSTLGLAGFFDVAGKFGLEPREEDFGQTLGYWGVGAGPFIVVPLLGPRTLRDGAGSIADVYTDPVGYIDHTRTRNVTAGTRVLDTRVQLFSAEEMITGDRYIFIRDAYLQRRAFLVNDGVVEDEFGGEDF
jgi:phospholipid-binding lipoprotein MlaA